MPIHRKGHKVITFLELHLVTSMIRRCQRCKPNESAISGSDREAFVCERLR